MDCKYVLFDLDGTLSDPGLGITNSVIHALGKYGVSVSDRRELYRFIGPPLGESFERYYGFSKEQAAQAITYYREYFADTGAFENVLYDGIPELLDELRVAGRTLIVATSKPTVFSVRILEYFGIADRFALVVGSELDGGRSDKAEVIACALERAGIADMGEAVMVGDREHDIIGARKNGLDSIGVLFGYGSREELIAAGAGHIAESVAALGGLLLGRSAE